MGIVGSKFEDVAVTAANKGIEVWQETLGIGNVGLEMKLGTIENHSAATVKT